jgi:hypothetical protein
MRSIGLGNRIMIRIVFRVQLYCKGMKNGTFVKNEVAANRRNVAESSLVMERIQNAMRSGSIYVSLVERKVTMPFSRWMALSGFLQPCSRVVYTSDITLGRKGGGIT